MKHNEMIQKFFNDLTESVKKGMMEDGEIDPQALLLVVDENGDYCMCGKELPKTLQNRDEFSLESIFHTKYLIGQFVKQVKEDGFEILAVLHVELVNLVEGDEKLFIFKKVWNDDSFESVRENSEFISVKRKDTFVNQEGELVHDIELVKEDTELF